MHPWRSQHSDQAVRNIPQSMFVTRSWQDRSPDHVTTVTDNYNDHMIRKPPPPPPGIKAVLQLVSQVAPSHNGASADVPTALPSLGSLTNKVARDSLHLYPTVILNNPQKSTKSPIKSIPDLYLNMNPVWPRKEEDKGALPSEANQATSPQHGMGRKTRASYPQP